MMKIGKDYIGVSVGAIILNEKGEVLLNKRSKKTKNEKGEWEAPGGAVKFGESREEAIKREIKEEFGIDIKILKQLHTVDEILAKDQQHWVATTYVAEIKGKKKPKIMEPEKSDMIGWFALNKLPKPLSFITISDVKEFKKQYHDLI